MSTELAELMPKLGDPRLEKEVVRELLSLPSDVRLALIEELSASGDAKVFRAAFRLAKSSLNDCETLLAFLQSGSQKSDASTIKCWLDVVTPKLGIRRVIRFFEDQLSSDPKSTIKARYWLPTLFPRSERVAADELNRLDSMISAQIEGDALLQKWFDAIRANR